jgi:prepilin-type N-terminal cleavage/methylation domain-containing protein
MKKKIQKGFTLIELLVVIAIIGILAGILFIAINPKEQSDKANALKFLSIMNNIHQKYIPYKEIDSGISIEEYVKYNYDHMNFNTNTIKDVSNTEG